MASSPTFVEAPGLNFDWLNLDTEQGIYYPAVCQAIHDTGYRDWVGHEFSPKGDALEALRQAYEQCLVK